MELNDITDYQRCFACGSRNPYGLHMIFHRDEGTIFADFQPHEEHQGFPGIIHGGIVAAALDEALNRTSLLGEVPVWTMTGRLEVRYRRNVPYGPLLRVRARLGEARGRMLQAAGILTLANDESLILAEAQGTFMALTPEVLDSLLKDDPGMRTFMEGSKK